MAPAKVLGEGFRAFQAGGRRARPETGDAGGVQPVDQAGDQGLFGADHDKIDRLVAGQGKQAVEIVGGHRPAVGDARHTGVAGRRQDLADAGRLADFPGQRVFAPAAADN